ncbi:MetQ/NlpA family lipoprotein [soil metagenome]
MIKILLTLLLASIILAGGLGLTACKPKQAENEIKVGVMSGPEAKLMETARDVALKQYGLKVKITEFTDYALPNRALNEGSIDAVAIHHMPYIDADIKANGYKISPMAKTFIYPVGIYSAKLKHMADVPDGASVAIPNDPSNEAHALLVLERSGLLRLKNGAGVTATPLDIIDNPKHLIFKELEAAQLPRVLPDVSLAAINTNYALLANLHPSKDALFVEGKDSLYVNIITVRTAELENPKLKQLVAAYHSNEVQNVAKELFKGEAIAGWKKVE